MKRYIPYLFMLVFGSTLAVVACRTVPEDPPEWTTNSPTALAAFDEGLNARSKYYHVQAREHFWRALEIDPDFVMPKVMLLRSSGKWSDEQKSFFQELEKIDFDTLNDREILLVRMVTKDYLEPDGAAQLVDTFLEEYPNDPYALEIRCASLTKTNMEAAIDCDEKLVAAHPNWVSSLNRLGYAAMALGNFEESEERFRTYRFIAPDQANPHDSLGELLILRGRWEEARKEFNRALEEHPGFCASYAHLQLLSIAEDDFVAAEEAVDQAADACEERELWSMQCDLRYHQMMKEGRYEDLTQQTNDSCFQYRSNLKMMVHRSSLLTGQWAVADVVEKDVEILSQQDKYRGKDSPKVLLIKLRGDRRIAEGDHEGLEMLAKVDQELIYHGSDLGIFKLLNQMDLGRSLQDMGFAEESERVYTRVSAINLPFYERLRVGSYPSPSAAME